MSVKIEENIEQIKLVSNPEEEPKIHINFYFFKLSLNIIFTITYLLASVFLNIINRIIFYNYNFNNYNFSFMFFQQLFSAIFFYILSNKSKTFKKQAGEISFNDFMILKRYYLSFAIVFILNTIVNFIATQMIVNATMFYTLRKLLLVKTYIYDLFFGNKKLTYLTSICVFLITLGSIISGINTFSRDYLGIFLTMISNIITLIYAKFTEFFRRKTGVSNLKLLVYNSYLSGPSLFIFIFITVEFKKLFSFFAEQKYLNDDKTEGSLFGFIFFILFSCSLVIVLNSSFFMSNEKNSSIFTILFANTKTILTSIFSRLFLKDNKYTINIVLGLIISTIGAIMFSLKSIKDNIIMTDKNNKMNREEDEPDINHVNQENKYDQILEMKSTVSSSENN